ncbi:MAG: Na-K-Cl cotransporter [Acidobacteriota bacterium]
MADGSTVGDPTRGSGDEGSTDGPKAQKFGTYLGVFTPSVLTILGLVMYLRFGWVVGNVGLGLTVVIVLLASSITLITALSASAVATNMQVGAGGEYYMISHSLGLELGVAIGIPLFLCRTLSITFYSFGLAEAVAGLWPPDLWPSVGGALPGYFVQLLAALTIVIITAVAGSSAALALKLQIPILIAVVLSIVALAVGVLTGPIQPPSWSADYETAPGGFWYVFAVFFPAVTGFAAGIGMSGDLADPRKSIPRGTLLAVATGTAAYLLIPVLLAITAQVEPEVLTLPGPDAWLAVALLGPILIYPGILGAILSSALGSVLGGPRVLQALATDGLAPRFLAKLSPTGQPTIATWISGGLALAGVALGGLNAVATLVTVLFLTLYMMINLSAAIEQLAKDPYYRPTIHVPWGLSLLGALGAVSVMFLISPLACLLAAVLELGLWLYLRRRSLEKQWGDVRAGLWLSLARFALLRLRGHAEDARNWRPHILVFVRDPERHIGLVRLASWFNQDRGVVTACRLIHGSLEHEGVDVAKPKRDLEQALSKASLKVFSEVNVVRDFESGAVDVTQANGIAGLHSNTVMFGWPTSKENLVSQLRIMRRIGRVGKSTLLSRLAWRHEPGQSKRIDVWWGGLENNGDMMLLFAYLLSLNPEWDDARIRVRSIVRNDEERRDMEEGLAALIPETRIRAETEIVVREPGRRVAEILHRRSADADVVILGLTLPKAGDEGEYAERLMELAEGLPTTIFVRNAGMFAGNLI